MLRIFPCIRPVLCLVMTISSLITATAAGGVPEGWFLWPCVEPVAESALDTSSINLDGSHGLPRIKTRDGHFITQEGKRVRFWGANLGAFEAFPADEKQADFIARLLAKGGVNLARLHHLDNPWGVGKGGSIWPHDNPAHRELDPVQLDKLHRLIARLRDHGIYSNLNLKVSKALVAADGFDPSVTQLTNFQKRVDIFDRRMIDLQKDYARRLLTVKNPYTGLAPAEDPAVAIVEINNENSLLGYWTNDLGRGLDRLPKPFREELRAQWNAWLARRYADDTVLAAAWAAPTAELAPSLVSPGGVWELKNQPGTAGTMQPGADATAFSISVSQAGGIDWHLQASLHNLTLADGEVYTVEFLAKADKPRTIGVGVSIDLAARPDESWRSFGLLETVELTADWKPVTLVFPAHSVGGAAAALGFNAGQKAGTIEVKQLRVHAGCAGAGLQTGQSIRTGTVPIPTIPSTKQWADWIHFLADTERAFAEEMRTFLKDELHVQALVVCSQIDYGGMTGMNREQSMDFADGHAYWQHPDFPGGDWADAKWTIGNSPQLAEITARNFGKLSALALVRVAGKPFTVSEYDHPAPSDFVCEMYPEFAAFACRQDWDALYPFAIGDYGATNPSGAIKDFFDQLHHPAKWGFAPFAARVFRQELIPSASAAALLNPGASLWQEQMHAEVLWKQLLPGGPIDFLNVRYAVKDRTGPAGAKANVDQVLGSVSERAPVRLLPAPRGKVCIIDAPQAAAVVGFLGGASLDAGALHVTCPRFGRDFASVTAVALDARSLPESGRVLLTLAARASNQDVVWNESRTSVGKNWGHGPAIAERVPATITLTGHAGHAVYALAPDGSRAKEIKTSTANGALTFSVQPGDNTLHYEIVGRR